MILITTKKAKSGEAVITFDARVGINKMNRKDTYDYITDPGEYYEAHYLALYNYYTNELNQSSQEAHVRANETLGATRDQGGLGYLVFTVPDREYLIGDNGKLNPRATQGRLVQHEGQDYWVQPDDWWKEGFRTGIRQDYSISVNGGSENTQFYGSIGYTNDEGIMHGSSFERFTARLRANHQAKK